MPTIVIETAIDAAAEDCFVLIRDHRLHADAQAKPPSDAPIRGQIITFESTFCGVRQTLAVEAVEVDRPRLLVDKMIKGPFAAFTHRHEFIPQNGGTMIRDTVSWTSPFGLLGVAADKILIERRLRRVVTERNRRLKLIAEASK